MSVLVTGGSGCLGYHILSMAIRSKGDLYSFSNEQPSSFRRLKHVEYIDGDLLDEKKVLDVLTSIRPDEIYHVAAQNSVGLSQIRPYDTLRTNILGTQVLLECIRKTVPKARVILVSSCEVYGSGKGVAERLHSEDDPLLPLTPFATSKASCEMLARQYRMAHSLEIMVLRPFHFTGPLQSTRYVIPDVARQIRKIEKESGELTIYTGNLDISRDYTDVRDVARAILLLSQAGTPGETYNICSGTAHTIRELVEFLVRLSELPLELRVDPTRERVVDIPLLMGSPDKITRLTGWKPMISLEDSLTDVYSEWKNLINTSENL